MWSGATCASWSCFEHGVGPGDLQRCLPTSSMLGLCTSDGCGKARKASCQHSVSLFATISLRPVESYTSFPVFCILANMSLPSFHVISAPSFALHHIQTCLQHQSTMLLSQSVFLRQSCERSFLLAMLASMLFPPSPLQLPLGHFLWLLLPKICLSTSGPSIFLLNLP